LSALAGILYFRGRAADQNDIAVLTRALRGIASNQCNCVREGPLAIAYRTAHTNQESYLDPQPLRSRQGHIIVFDGRLDNRDELLRSVDQSPHSRCSDARIVLSVYERFAQNSFRILIGDFTLTVWDATQRQLALVRDPLGVRAVYYRPLAGAIFWSTNPNHILCVSRYVPEVNDDYVFDFLVGETGISSTPYKDIHVVAPATVVVAKEAELRISRYWNPHPTYRIKYKSDKDYEEHFLHVFQESVRNRLRVCGTVCAELSGGLDSSSIVCVADGLIKGGKVQADRLLTISYRYDESKSADEYDFIRSVEEKIERKGIHLWESDFRMFSQFAQHPFGALPNVMWWFGGRDQLVANVMKAQDAKVILRGTGGDHLMLSHVDYPPDLADYLAKGDLVKLHRTIVEWTPVLPQPYIHYLLKGAVLPLLPRWVRVLKRFLEPRLDSDTTLLALEFLRRMRARKRLQEPKEDFGFSRPPSSRYCALSLARLVSFVSKGLFQGQGFEFSLPFLDRPLVEFCLAIPIQQKVGAGQTRSLQRRALGPFLPPKIAERMSKGSLTEGITRAWMREIPTLVRNLGHMEVCSRGYVDRTRFFAALDRSLHGFSLDIDKLTKVLSVELWLRDLSSIKADHAAAGGKNNGIY
jgi:asparagine synthase (glutamine-hydrolysing)